MKRHVSGVLGGLFVVLAVSGCRREERALPGPKPEVISAKLVLSQGDAGTFVIVEETDEPSSRRQDAVRSNCATTAAVAVNALPEVERATANAFATAEKSGDKVRFGGLGPYDDGEGGLFSSLGLHTDERFEEQITYTVRKGVLTVRVLGSAATRSMR